MRLLIVSQDFPPDIGGIQTYAAELALRLARRCAYAAVVAPARAGTDAVDARFEADVYRLRARPDLLPLAALPYLPRLARRHRFDVALHAQWQTAAASLVARRLTGYPRKVVVAAHGRELRFSPSPVTEYARRWVLRGADRFLPVSRYTAGLLEELGVSPDAMAVVHNGTDPGAFYPEPKGTLRAELGLEARRVLLTVARLAPHKGVDTTLRALPPVVAAMPEVVYLIAGTGPERARLEALAEELGVAPHVRFLGAVPEDGLRRLLNACDAFVMPSREIGPNVEGFGIAFLEANACGKPVIGTTSGGIPDAVRDGETGLLVPPDDPEALAGAIRTLLGDAALAERLGRQGRERVVASASWDRVAERVYAELEAACA